MPTNGTANCCCQSKTLKHPENTAERKTMRRWRKTRTGNYVFNTRRRFLRAAERYPSKICDGITKWMQNRFEPVEWPTRNEIRCECEDSCMPPGPLPPPFAGEHFSFKSISFRNARYFVVVRSRVRVSFRNPSRNPIYRGHTVDTARRGTNMTLIESFGELRIFLLIGFLIWKFVLITWFWAFCSAIAFSFACLLHLYRWFWNHIFTCNRDEDVTLLCSNICKFLVAVF